MARDGSLMASAFDPSRFIAAEAERASQPLAAPATEFGEWLERPKAAENRAVSPPSTPALAGIAGIAGPDLSGLPFDADVRRFLDQSCPVGMLPEQWGNLTSETWDVHRNWAVVAIELGWSSLDLFGCNPDPYARRVDRNGLTACMFGLRTPVRVVEITSAYAELACRSGAPMRYRPPPAPGAVHIWEAYRMATGP